MNSTKDRIALLFPGQGSQSLGMGQQIASAYELAAQTYSAADRILGYSLSAISWHGPEEKLNDTEYTQPALFVHSVSVLKVIRQLFPDFHPDFVAGHSMGELSALFAAKSFTFEAGLKLVQTRGQLMKQAGDISPGGMAAILGLSIAALEEICTSVSRDKEIVQIANDNSPGQVVISGSSAALERAMQAAQEAGARRTVRLAVSIAAHSPLMSHVQERFNEAVGSVEISDPAIPIIGNVQALPLLDADNIRIDLQAQLNSRVRWTESIEYMVSQGVSIFLEIGNNSVLTGLLKRIDRSAKGYAIGNPADIDNLFEIL